MNIEYLIRGDEHYVRSCNDLGKIKREYSATWSLNMPEVGGGYKRNSYTHSTLVYLRLRIRQEVYVRDSVAVVRGSERGTGEKGMVMTENSRVGP